MEEIEKCSNTVIHQHVVDEVKREMPRNEEFVKLAELFKVFGDPTRIKIIYALLKKEMCVCDLSALLEMSQSAISHQLKTLKQSRTVKFRREGKVVYYSLDDEHIAQLFMTGYKHIIE